MPGKILPRKPRQKKKAMGKSPLAEIGKNVVSNRILSTNAFRKLELILRPEYELRASEFNRIEYFPTTTELMLTLQQIWVLDYGFFRPEH